MHLVHLHFDVAGRKWATFLINKLEFKEELFPPCYEPYDVAGEVTTLAAKETGLKKRTHVVYGGGAKSNLWLQIQADVFDTPVSTTKTVQEACVGAAIIAGVGVGVYSSIEEDCRELISFNSEVIEPIQENVRMYSHYYNLYKGLHMRNKDLFEF